MDVADALRHLDLCVLAYHLYHQSVVWPLDPWYEILGLPGWSRRDNFMCAVHNRVASMPLELPGQLYGGPAVLRGLGESNRRLDPVVTNYRAIRPHAPVWNGDGGWFLGIQTPAYIVDRIRNVSVCVRTRGGTGPNAGATVEPLYSHTQGTDELIAFEGGTGTLDSTPAFSLMGYVLAHDLDAGRGWELCIVFRGSRSGDATRAALHAGIGTPDGNADWVTDCASELVKNEYLSAVGKVHTGFSSALETQLPTIEEAILRIRRATPPSRITVAGHSLGAGLAALWTCAVTLGKYGERLRKHRPAWPWDELRPFLIAEPPVADEAVIAALEGKVTAWAPYCHGDPVVECAFGFKKASGMGKGMALAAHGGQVGTLVGMDKPRGADAKENPHEVYLIRRALVARAVAEHQNLPGAIARATPWAVYACFADLCAGRAVSTRDATADEPKIVTAGNLRETLVRHDFAHHFAIFLELYRQIMGPVEDLPIDPRDRLARRRQNSYRGVHKSATYQAVKERITLAMDLAPNVTDQDSLATQLAVLFAFEMDSDTQKALKKAAKSGVAELRRLSDEGVELVAEELIGQSLDRLVGLGLVLSWLQKQKEATLASLDTRKHPELGWALEALLPNRSDAQLERARAAIGKTA